MNKFLADALASLNALFAVLIILVGVYLASQQREPHMVALVFVASLLVSVAACGFTALLIEIRASLTEILLEQRFSNNRQP